MEKVDFNYNISLDILNKIIDTIYDTTFDTTFDNTIHDTTFDNTIHDTKTTQDKKTIHFILPGGGVRGSFQAGFLWCIRTHYSELYETYQIDGSSVGALNGFAYILKNPDDIRNIWFSINSIDDIFNPYSDKPIWCKLKTLYNGFYEKSISQNDGLRSILKNNACNIDKKYLHLYNCVATNIYTGNYEYINGENQDILDYILASASPWIIAPPIAISNYLYIDGGLLQTYPIENIKNSNADIKIIIGTDNTHKNKIGMPGTNIFHYLTRLIDISRFNNSNINKLDKYINKYNIINIENPLECPFLEFSTEQVRNGFNLGIDAAHKFAQKYLIQ